MKRFQKHSRFAALFLSTLVLIVFAMNGCQQQKTSPPEKITIAYSTAPNALLMDIALAKDYFREEGLEATPQPHPFGKPALRAVIDGKADIATVGDTPIVFAVMNGRKITTLASIQTSNRDHAIVANRERGIDQTCRPEREKNRRDAGDNGAFLCGFFSADAGYQRKTSQVCRSKARRNDRRPGSGKS